MKCFTLQPIKLIISGILIMSFFTNCHGSDHDKVRHSAVAGGFYPSDPATLRSMIESMVADAEVPSVKQPVMALIAPHAGYVYSGQVAAYAYALLQNREIRRVIILSPCHVEAFEGASVYDGEAYETPLGAVPVDQDFCRKLSDAHPLIHYSGKGHDTGSYARGEHAVEVQIPFLQTVLTDFKIVPVVMGDQDYQTCRALGYALAKLIPDEKTVIVTSSDLSHFHSYDEAVRKDRSVLKAIEEWDYYNLHRNLRGRTWEACGGGPIIATMIAVEQRGANVAKLLKYANSGDVPRGDRSSVVGYSAFAFFRDPDLRKSESEFELSIAEQKTLLKMAREAVETMVISGRKYACEEVEQPGLLIDRGAFVTLKINGALRGCIGYTAPIMPLYQTVCEVAVQAALKDPRFRPVSKAELADLEYDISVLSPFRHVGKIEDIKIGTHGLLIQKGRNAGLLLPQVAIEQGWDRETFLQHTCRKAGLLPDDWQDPEADMFMFSAFVFAEE